MEMKDYMKLPYTRIVREMNDESGHYFYGKILELDGCQSTGDTLDELYYISWHCNTCRLSAKTDNRISKL